MTNVHTDHASQQQALQNLILDDDLERLEDLLADFNLFDVLGIARAELQHSTFLAWLLDPRGSHGLRDYFLRAFLSQAAREASKLGIGEITPFDVDSWNLREIEIATERHRIDILILGRSDEFVCLIENKIGSGEHGNQLSRYLDTVEKEYELTPFPIFLTPEGNPPETEADAERYVPIDYGKIAGLIDRVLQARRSTISASVCDFLEQYARTLRRHILNDRDNIDELANRIYDNHRDAIDLIIKAQSNRDAIVWEVIESTVRRCMPDDFQADHHIRSFRRYFSSYLDEIRELGKGQGWTESGRILLFEVKYDRGGLSLYLMMGPGPEDTRKRLKAIADDGRVPGVPMRRANRLGSKWHFIYRKPILSQEDVRFSDITSRVAQAVSEFCEKDYWPIVNAIREEFGLPAVNPNQGGIIG